MQKKNPVLFALQGLWAVWRWILYSAAMYLTWLSGFAAGRPNHATDGCGSVLAEAYLPWLLFTSGFT
mgnify:CR=1 FL=1